MASHGKTGVLIVNLGTPDSPTRFDVYRYLREFLTDARVIDYPWIARQLLVQGIIAPFRSGSSAKLYQELWTEQGSPLKFYGENLVEEVKPLLGDDCIVKLAMRYQSPSLESTIKELLDEDIDKLVVFSLFPQYASATVGSVHDEVMRILRKEENIPELVLIRDYYDHPQMISCFANNAKDFEIADYDHILFSFHGLPERQLKKADKYNHCAQKENCCSVIGKHNQYCYSAQCHSTAQHIAKELGLNTDDYSICFQSRLGPEKWAQPYTSDIIKQRSDLGDKKLLVLCPAFTADCLETTIEISVEYKEEFEEMGGEVIDLVPSLNDQKQWAVAVANIIKEKANIKLANQELAV